MKKLVILVMVLFQFSAVFALDCPWGGDFYSLVPNSDVVAKVRVLGFQKIEGSFSECLVCEQIQIYKGKSEADTIWLRNYENICSGLNLRRFVRGDEYIFQYDESKSDSTLRMKGGGEYFVKINKGLVYSDERFSESLTLLGKMKVEEFETNLERVIRSPNYDAIPRARVASSQNIEILNEPKQFGKRLILSLLLVLGLVLAIYRKRNKLKLSRNN